ncbi:MAG: hypothetical protein V8T36_04000 [Ruthenibacterium lactatiformans]
MGTILTAFLLPFILIIVCLCGMMDAAADHNRAAVEWCFGDGAIPAAAPEEYAGHITQMRACFAVLDGAVGKLNAELEEGSVPLRANRVKADFFALNFGAPDLTLRQGQASLSRAAMSAKRCVYELWKCRIRNTTRRRMKRSLRIMTFRRPSKWNRNIW